MRAKESKRVGVASGKDGVDLEAQTSGIIRALVERVRCGGALFGQVHSLENANRPARVKNAQSRGRFASMEF